MEDQSVESKNKKLFKMMKDSSFSSKKKEETGTETEKNTVKMKTYYDSDEENKTKKSESNKTVTMETEEVDPYYPSEPLFSRDVEGKDAMVVINEYSEKSIAIYIIGKDAQHIKPHSSFSSLKKLNLKFRSTPDADTTKRWGYICAKSNIENLKNVANFFDIDYQDFISKFKVPPVEFVKPDYNRKYEKKEKGEIIRDNKEEMPKTDPIAICFSKMTDILVASTKANQVSLYEKHGYRYFLLYGPIELVDSELESIKDSVSEIENENSFEVVSDTTKILKPEELKGRKNFRKNDTSETHSYNEFRLVEYRILIE